MDPNAIALIIAIAGAAGTVLSFIIGRREKASASDAQTSAHISSAYKDLVDSLQKRVETLEKTYEENKILKKENEQLKKRLSKLTIEVEKLKKRLEQVTQENKALKKRLSRLENG